MDGQYIDILKHIAAELKEANRLKRLELKERIGAEFIAGYLSNDRRETFLSNLEEPQYEHEGMEAV